MEDDRGMALEFESMVCIQNLGGRQMSRFMRAGLCDSGVGVVFFRECFLSPKS